MNRRRLVDIELYEQLEYIYSTTGAYIVTDIKPLIGSDKLEIKFQNRTAQTSKGKIMCGTNWSTGSNIFAVLDSGSLSRFSLRCGTSWCTNGMKGNYNAHVAIMDTKNHIYKFDNSSCTVSQTDVQLNGKLCICSYGEPAASDWSQFMYDGKIFYLKYWRDGVQIADFVPARRKSDGVIGMVDLMSGGFYQSPTGTFIGG